MTITPVENTSVLKQPEPFLEVRVQELTINPSAIGLCVGYEVGEWRAAQFADHVMEWLPEFALTYSELLGIHSGNMVALMREAASKIYKTEKFRNRGEFGELFLHAAIRQVFGAIPAISKIYYKSARNDTVKGFDAVHVIATNEGFELWLGEAKFYSDINSAITDVVKELQTHTQRDYLRDEFVLISGKLDAKWPHAEELKKLLSPRTSLDEVFKRVSMPVLLTYDSPTIAKFHECSENYKKDFHDEIMAHHRTFSTKKLPKTLTIHLFLMPLETKKKVICELDKKLRIWQKV
jgi:hypothetical protein